MFAKRLSSRVKWLTTNPGNALGLCVSAATLTCAAMDLMRSIDDDEMNRSLTMSERFKDRKRFAEALETMHAHASRGTLTYHTLAINRELCAETAQLWRHAEAERTRLLHRYGPGTTSDISEAEIELVVAQLSLGETKRLSRRAMLRRGHAMKWFAAAVQDELVDVVVLPTVAIVLGRPCMKYQ